MNMNHKKQVELFQRMNGSLKRLGRLIELEAPFDLIENERKNLKIILDELIVR